MQSFELFHDSAKKISVSFIFFHKGKRSLFQAKPFGDHGGSVGMSVFNGKAVFLYYMRQNSERGHGSGSTVLSLDHLDREGPPLDVVHVMSSGHLPFISLSLSFYCPPFLSFDPVTHVWRLLVVGICLFHCGECCRWTSCVNGHYLMLPKIAESSFTLETCVTI